MFKQNITPRHICQAIIAHAPDRAGPFRLKACNRLKSIKAMTENPQNRGKVMVIAGLFSDIVRNQKDYVISGASVADMIRSETLRKKPVPDCPHLVKYRYIIG